MKRIITVFLSLCMVIGTLISPHAINFVSNVCAVDTTETTSGTCGEELTWTLDSEGQLTISGKGPMKDSHFNNRQDITSVIVEEGVTSIEASVFKGCSNISSVTMADSVTSIGNHAFDSCHALTSVKLSDSITSIPEWCFGYCNELTSITIPKSVKNIEMGAFQCCEKLVAVIIPEGASSIGKNAFVGCKALESVTMPSSVYNIEPHAFSGTKWLENKQNENPFVIVNGILIDATKCSGEVTIPDGAIIIGGYAFACDTIESVILPSSVKTICNDAFYGCSSLKSISIPNSVISLGDGAFWCCTKLESVTIPASVSKIPKSVFYCCWSLTSITILNPEAEILTDLYGVPADKLTFRGYKESTAELFVRDFYNPLVPDIKTFESIGYPIPATMYGDVNCDDTVDIEDVAILYGYLNGTISGKAITYQGRVNGDVYCPPSGLTKEDAMTIEDYINGIVTTLPVTTASTTTTTTNITTTTTSKTTTITSNTTTTTTTTSSQPAMTKAGDVNCDGTVDMADAVLIMQSLANPNKYGIGGTDEHALTEQGQINADVDKGSKGLTLNDALKIQQLLLGINKSF